nr:MAG TPA: hypothetical protein [Caudoviricetes sp.]DAY31097.1 MAG TPA: hypothetical protein [Bacteriophage sp.]
MFYMRYISQLYPRSKNLWVISKLCNVNITN